ncbi:hypothetical protein G6F46_003449 [Rhizopus delemar]|uniref:Uncharacterized protein n=2 Tax=Rhizopus TaxID=4842 RepID=A0A9P6Z900_9FUNG|nr:hypothetical protein G6F55_002401 [Rhizopus delemar]KAG1548515.1 hypothetical protein G6F51_003610 [Rhizopus arrhizus]KAG1501337.1 hypothetical protein G6F54_003117 [Rhizopus delemar]KAG1515403.1 hypothetical protein G6F53_002952 [Rhizopus delemar]KAG1526038.1 hypothetical protein G6F52_002787 [Rhizopus delemar]
MKRIRQLVRRIWYFVDTAFNNASIDVRTGEKESRASSSRRNQGRINKERKKHGHKTEFLFKFNQGELGCAEVGKEDTGDEDLKLRAITLDRPLTYICYDRYILKHIIQSTASTGFQTQSAVISGAKFREFQKSNLVRTSVYVKSLGAAPFLNQIYAPFGEPSFNEKSRP